MRLYEIKGLSNPIEINDFKKTFVDPKINKHVQQQAARKNPAWKRSLVQAMKKYGFEMIGAGINGAVFKNPKYPFVLKIFREDRGFDEWLYFALSNQNNKFVPKLKGKPIRLNKIFTAIRMEPLEPCPNADLVVSFIKTFDELMERPSLNDPRYGKKDDDQNLIKIVSFCKDFEPFVDMTAHNLMSRMNGEIVIIDPIYINPNEKTDWFDI